MLQLSRVMPVTCERPSLKQNEMGTVLSTLLQNPSKGVLSECIFVQEKVCL